jgi:putative transposase
MIKSTTIHREGVEWIFSQPLNVQLEVLSNHLEICKAVVNSLLSSNVEQQAGVRYCHEKPYQGRYSRWGVNPGSVRIGNQKVCVSVPRIKDNELGTVSNVEMYNAVKDLPEQKEEMVMSVLKGISMRDYSQVANQLLDSFGLSPSSVSRHFVERSSEAVANFCNRRWDDTTFVALFIDGKSLAGEQMIIALGVDEYGHKIPLSVTQSGSENSTVIAAMLEELKGKGFKDNAGLLVVIDGSKGIRKAVEQVFGHNAVVQRCQWHKRENVVSYLKQSVQEDYRKKLQNAYRQADYEQAKNALQQLAEDLKKQNLQASRSLLEGLEETLTIQRLGVLNELGKSFSTTNCIENLNSQIDKYVRKVKNWMNSDQRHRWVIMAMTEAETKMNKVQGHKNLHLLQQVLKIELKKPNQNSSEENNLKNSTNYAT